MTSYYIIFIIFKVKKYTFDSRHMDHVVKQYFYELFVYIHCFDYSNITVKILRKREHEELVLLFAHEYLL